MMLRVLTLKYNLTNDCHCLLVLYAITSFIVPFSWSFWLALNSVQVLWQNMWQILGKDRSSWSRSRAQIAKFPSPSKSSFNWGSSVVVIFASTLSAWMSITDAKSHWLQLHNKSQWTDCTDTSTPTNVILIYNNSRCQCSIDREFKLILYI